MSSPRRLWDRKLEFYSIKVQDGRAGPRKLQHIQPGDEIILRPKPVGTLVMEQLLPGKRLCFLRPQHGFAPFASLLRDRKRYEEFESDLL